MIDPTIIDFLKGEVWLVDKPYEWTSSDVVRKIKYAIKRKTGLKKFKIGHAGTLDPLATGLLVICIGRKTKEISSIQSDIKEYTGIIRLGATTPSYDLETPIDRTFDISSITNENIFDTAKKLTGDLIQAAPIYSARKIDGQRAYKLARRGVEKVVSPHSVTIYKFEITKIEMPDVWFKVECSKGTYIRSLASDFGKLLDNGAHLKELRRTANGTMRVENGKKLEEILSQLSVDGQPVELVTRRIFKRTE